MLASSMRSTLHAYLGSGTHGERMTKRCHFGVKPPSKPCSDPRGRLTREASKFAGRFPESGDAAAPSIVSGMSFAAVVDD
jgi:hypothetical protein